MLATFRHNLILISGIKRVVCFENRKKNPKFVLYSCSILSSWLHSIYQRNCVWSTSAYRSIDLFFQILQRRNSISEINNKILYTIRRQHIIEENNENMITESVFHQDITIFWMNLKWQLLHLQMQMIVYLRCNLNRQTEIAISNGQTMTKQVK